MNKFSIAIAILVLTGCSYAANEKPSSADNVKVTILSTMLSDYKGIGEWGFAALVEVDDYKILFDTGAHPETVLANARDLNIDLSLVEDVFLSHYHWDHVGGLLTLRKELMKQNPKALSKVHVGEGIFYSRPKNGKEGNPMIAIKQEFEALGGSFIVYNKPSELFKAVWITGPVPRKYLEKNWNGSGKMITEKGLKEDIIPEDMSMVINTPKGWVLVAGCGHSGIVNTMEYVQTSLSNNPVYAAIGGFHLYKLTDEKLEWTATKLTAFGVSQFLGAHCTGINSTFIIREKMGLTRETAVVGAVGNVFELGNGIDAGKISK